MNPILTTPTDVAGASLHLRTTIASFEHDDERLVLVFAPGRGYRLIGGTRVLGQVDLTRPISVLLPEADNPVRRHLLDSISRWADRGDEVRFLLHTGRDLAILSSTTHRDEEPVLIPTVAVMESLS